MAITQIDYPVTGSAGSYKNLFPSQKPININFKREDGTLLSIVSGVDNKVRVAINETFENILEGDTVIFFSDGYKLQSTKVLSVIDASTVELDILFDSSDVTNGFINYKKNWFLEVRYVEADSASNDQAAIEILEDFSQIPSALNGNVNANISLPSDLITPDFTLVGIQENLFVEYKVQFRESYDGQRLLPWVSPSEDIPILLVHATVNLTSGFTDLGITKRFAQGYPLNYFIVYSNINDQGNNTFKVNLLQYALDKTLIQSDEIEAIDNLNGVYNLAVDTDALNVNTRFIEFNSQLITNSGQYEGAQYNAAQYA